MPAAQQQQPPQQAEAQPEWNEDDRYTFDDSDRFEEDSLCSWSSEPESLCNNWRGWKRPIANSNFGNGSLRKQNEGKFRFFLSAYIFHLQFQMDFSLFRLKEEKKSIFVCIIYGKNRHTKSDSLFTINLFHSSKSSAINEYFVTADIFFSIF